MKHQTLPSKGFTLIETIVMIGIVGILGLLLNTIIIQIFRSQTKTSAVSQIRQNGQLVLDNLEKDLRAASEVCVTESKRTIVIFQSELSEYQLNLDNTTDTLAKQNVFVRYRFFNNPPDTNVGGFAGSNGFVSREEVTSFKDRCNDTENNTKADISGHELTNIDPITGISIKEGRFSVVNLGDKQAVMVSFKAGLPIKAPGQIRQEDVLFSNTIELRNTIK